MATTLDFARFQDSTSLIEQPTALRLRAQQDGYVYLRGIVQNAKLSALRSRILGICADLGWIEPVDHPHGVRARNSLGLGASDDARYHAFLARVIPSPEFAAIGDDDALVSVLSAIAGAPIVRRHADICRVLSPDSERFTTLPHQDHHYLGGPEPGWAVWIPVVDCPLSLGPLALLRASHTGGTLSHETDGMVSYIPETNLGNDWVTGDLKSGDAVIFHGQTVHQALPNRSGSLLRLSVDFRYLPA